MGEALTPSDLENHWEPDIVFSLRDGFVWVSWPETEAAIKLGRHEAVAHMMRDFLAQDALGQRLTELEGKSGESCAVDRHKSGGLGAP
jgi:hypothetical protein